MALGVADLAYVLDVGEVSLSGPAAELARTDEVQRLYLGHDADEPATAPGASAPAPDAVPVAVLTAAEPGRRGPRRHPGRRGRRRQRPLRRRSRRCPRCRSASSRARSTRSSAPTAPASRRCSTSCPASTGAEGEVRFGDTVLDRHAPAPDRRLGIARAFQNIALSAHPDGGREPHARPAPPDQGRASSPSGLRLPRATREARRHGERIGEIAELPRARRQARHPGRRPLLRRPEAGRGGPGAVHRARVLLLDEPVAGHERRGDRPDGRGIREIRVGAGHLRRPRRARHGHGHGAWPTG